MCRKILSALAIFLALACPPSWSQPVPVAHVALSVGQATKISATGLSETLQIGSPLLAGERIRTATDAVAILVFADDGRVSLRADSELLIRHYELDPSGVKTRIELELIKGTVRQISGRAARAQPERYRLNTPIAVIGVRGTDFLAKTHADSVEAFVHEGQIVLTPVNAAAPLAMASAAGPAQYIRLWSSGQLERRAFQPGELEKVFGIDLARAGKTNAALALSRAAPEFQLPPGTHFVTDTIFAAYAGTDNRQVPAPAHAATPAPAPVAPPVAVIEVPALAVVTTPVPLPTQLVWGRFSNADALPDTLLIDYAQASQGRHVTVGELGQYALWRADPSGRLDPTLKGQADFSLAGAQAVLAQGGAVSAAHVLAASLSVNFDQSTFAAGVDLRHPQTGVVSLNVTGRVNDEGVFVGTRATERVAGALSRDASQAGYLFSKDVAAGTLRGITLWSRP